MKKKIVWLCAFSNNELVEKLGAKNSKIVSPWMSEFINLFRQKTDFNIYIVSPNYINNTNTNVKIDNLEVYLFKFHPKFIPEKFYNLSIHYSLATANILKIISKIKPDIIHLFGAENPVYCSAVANNLFTCPILVSPQAFIRNSLAIGNPVKRFIRWNRIRYESKILKDQIFFTVATNDVVNELNKTNTASFKFKMAYPTTYSKKGPDFEKYCKEYDISYFAQISKEKGIEDFLELVVRLKEKFPTIRAIVIGGGNELYIKQIKKKIVNLDLSDNIYFAGFQKTQNDAFELLIKSKVYVLPTYYDGLPGTIRESMYLKVAVVAYAVGGIPRLNDNIECIKSVPVHDIDVMLNEVTNLLVDEQKRTLLINNAFSVITQDYSNDNVLTDLVNIYKKILYEQKN